MSTRTARPAFCKLFFLSPVSVPVTLHRHVVVETDGKASEQPIPSALFLSKGPLELTQRDVHAWKEKAEDRETLGARSLPLRPRCFPGMLEECFCRTEWPAYLFHVFVRAAA